MLRDKLKKSDLKESTMCKISYKTKKEKERESNKEMESQKNSTY